MLEKLEEQAIYIIQLNEQNQQMQQQINELKKSISVSAQNQQAQITRLQKEINELKPSSPLGQTPRIALSQPPQPKSLIFIKESPT